MKTFSITIIGIATLGLLCSGCSKQEEAPSTTTESSSATEKSTEASPGVGEAVQAVTDATRSAAENVAQDATKLANETATNASDEVQSLIERAKTFVQGQDYTEATATLQKLANLKLTPEQQQMVAGLKEQIQKALGNKAADNAAKAATDLLGR